MYSFDLAGAFAQLMQNKIFIITVSVWIIGQGIKMIINILRGKRFNFRWFIGTGGMPSSHAAGVAALATSCGLEYGFDSGMFALAAVFAMVTMFDAQGVRRQSGQQAEVMNKVLDDMYWNKQVGVERVKEFVGHTPVQVFVGSVLGFSLAVLFY
ncbi:MAG: divergent PAP2 family protein [Candidatus Omnitrophica bacterium]|nr:divergent PAP2 family protein [Candidatus Omnitrophota bacterium]